MKKLSMLAIALISATSTSAIYAQNADQPMLGQGTKELALSGTIEFIDFDEVDFNVDASYGYFVRDGWELGVRVLGSDFGGVERFDFSAFTEYNFNRASNMVPFVGASAGVADFSYDDGSLTGVRGDQNEDGSATVVEIQAGIKWFIRPYMAVSTAIGFNVSSDDIYAAGGDLEDNLTRFRIGLRYYF